jgi:hypothetical protein
MVLRNAFSSNRGDSLVFQSPPYYITNDIAGYPEIASMKSLQYKVGPH